MARSSIARSMHCVAKCESEVEEEIERNAETKCGKHEINEKYCEKRNQRNIVGKEEMKERNNKK